MKNREWQNRRQYSDDHLKEVADKMGIKSKNYELLEDAKIWYMMQSAEIANLKGEREALAWRYELGRHGYYAFDIMGKDGETCSLTFVLNEKAHEFHSDNPVVPLKSAISIINLFAKEFDISVEWKEL